MVRANLQPEGAAVDVRLGRSSSGTVEREIRLTWTDACSAPAGALSSLEAIEGVLSGSNDSLSTKHVEVRVTEAIDKSVTMIVGIPRSIVDPGKFEGTIAFHALDDGVVFARGQVPIVIQRQEAVFGPHWVWSPGALLVVATLGGLVFGWWRALALSGTELTAGLREQRRLAVRNLVGVVGAIGAGIAAWSINYLRAPDFRFDAEALLTLFVVVAGPVATTLLTFLRPADTTRPADVADTQAPEADASDAALAVTP